MIARRKGAPQREGPMQTIWAEHALIGGVWERDVYLYIAGGHIRRIVTDCDPADNRVALLVPAPANVHHHAALRALAEGGGAVARPEAQRRLLDRMTPDDLEAVAALAQMEMLETGYGACVEFHRLHNAPDGTPYSRPAEMAERVVAAAGATGIGLALVPVHTRYGGADGRAPGPHEARFATNREQFARLVEGARAACADLARDAVVGVSPHSLREVPADHLGEVTAQAGGGPVHMHLAASAEEVEEVRAALGARPGDWALENLPLDGRWCLIHCAHLDRDETRALGATGAVTGLCPVARAGEGGHSLDLAGWLRAGGGLGVGSGGNLRPLLPAELAPLLPAFAAGGDGAGRRLLAAAARGGARAAGRGAGRIEPGAWADLLALDTTHPDLAGLSPDAGLDRFVRSAGTAAGRGMVRHVWAAGRHLVRDGRHVWRERILSRYEAAASGLRAAL